MTSRHSSESAVKAGALLCPVCCVEYVEVELDFEVDGEILHNVKVLRCPVCQDEQFPPETKSDFAGTEENSKS